MPAPRLREIEAELIEMGLEPDHVEEDGGLLASCGETVLHVQCLGTPEAPYVRARNLVLADVEVSAESLDLCARSNPSAPTGAFVHEATGGVVRLGGVFSDTPECRPAIPSTLWALAMGGERVHGRFREALGGYTWAEAGREDHELGALPPERPLQLRRPENPADEPLPEARRRVDRILPDLWPDGERIRLGEGHHALRTGDATHEVSLAPRPYRTTVSILTRLVGDLDATPPLVGEINRWNDGMGFAAFGYQEAERMLVCSSSLPGSFLAPEALGPLLRLHAALAAQHVDAVLASLGGRPALEAQAGR